MRAFSPRIGRHMMVPASCMGRVAGHRPFHLPQRWRTLGYLSIHLIEHSGASTTENSDMTDAKPRPGTPRNPLTQHMIDEAVAAHPDLSRKKCIELLIGPPREKRDGAARCSRVGSHVRIRAAKTACRMH